MRGLGMDVAVIGCGHWGRNLVRNMAHLGHLSMVCDATEAGRETARALAPEAKVVADLEDVLASDVGGVVVATPAATHYDVTRRALLAGKDVLCEKPLALSHEEGEELARLANERGRVLMVGHVLEYHPGILALRELVTAGELGTVQYIYSNRLSLGKVRREENILWSFAPHDVAIILRILGRMPIEVAATGGTYLQPTVPDVTVTNLLFEGGARAHIFVSWLHPFKEHRLVVVGSQRMATLDDVTKRLVLHDKRVDIRDGFPIPVSGEGRDIAFGAQEPLRLECEAFLEAMRTRCPPLTDSASAVRVLRVLEAAQASLATHGRPVVLPAEGAL